MVNDPKKSKKILDPTEAALSAIREALNLRATDDQQQSASDVAAGRSQDTPQEHRREGLSTNEEEQLRSSELRELTAWLRRELRNLTDRLDLIVAISAELERNFRIPDPDRESSASESQPKRLEQVLSAIRVRVGEALGSQDDLSAAEQPRPDVSAKAAQHLPMALQPEEVDRFAWRLEQDLIDGVAWQSAWSPEEGPRELDYRELAFRLHHDLLDLAANSPEAKIRAAAYTSQVMARKLVGARAFAHRVPLPERYYPKPPTPPVETSVPRILRTGELPGDVVKAMERAEMDPRHAHLDKLLEE